MCICVKILFIHFYASVTYCAIFEDFLIIIFGNYNLDTSIIELRAINVKNLEISKK